MSISIPAALMGFTLKLYNHLRCAQRTSTCNNFLTREGGLWLLIPPTPRGYQIFLMPFSVSVPVAVMLPLINHLLGDTHL